MLSNKQIKNKELYKEQQNLIRALGELKRAQQELLLAFNEMALSELRKDNKLKSAVIQIRGKNAIKRYFKAYADKVIIEEHITQLREWKAED